ncbi:hypothetical protein EDB85DRAFT_1900484 [Lactarius pseudohatsudake]|nr:hypothetical protein EDB85DRAFT_1900484 [Lactarius pseudohatsudake]
MDMLAEALLVPATSCRGRGDGVSRRVQTRFAGMTGTTLRRGGTSGEADDERCMWLFDWSVSLFLSHTTPMQPLKRKRDELPTTPQKLRKIQLTIIPNSLDIPATPPPSPPPPSPVGDGVVRVEPSCTCTICIRNRG